MSLRLVRSTAYSKDYKRLAKRHYPMDKLTSVLTLIVTDTDESRTRLLNKHRRHMLSGKWAGYDECHVTNVADDWLVTWYRVDSTTIVLSRTGTHDEIFGQNNTKAPPPLPRLD